MEVEIDDPLIGTEVGRYRLTRLLGEGGMGRVYLAVQPMIGSRVAVKILSDQCARNPELLERFFAEARAVNLIRHEGIVNVIDMAMLPDGRPYIVMEFVEPCARDRCRSVAWSRSRAKCSRRSPPRTRSASSIAISNPTT